MKKILIVLPVIIYVGASAWASFDLFPEDFMQYWWFDDVMHVLVFGTVALSAAYICQQRLGSWWIGIVGTAALAIIDELVQLFIPARAVSLQDPLMSLVGVGVAALICFYVFKKAGS